MGVVDVIKKVIDFFKVDDAMEDQMLQNNTDDDKHNLMRDATTIDKAKDNMVNSQDCNAHSYEHSEQMRQQSFKVIENGPAGPEPQQRLGIYAKDGKVKNEKTESYNDDLCKTTRFENIEEERVDTSSLGLSNSTNNEEMLIASNAQKQDSQDLKQGQTDGDIDSQKHKENKEGNKEKKVFKNDNYDDRKSLRVLTNTHSDDAGVQVVEGKFVLGEPAGTFRQRPRLKKKTTKNGFHKADLIADIAYMENLIICGASLRGEVHYANKEARQDNFLIDGYTSKDGQTYAIAILSDGVSNSAYSDVYAEYMVNYANFLIQSELEKVGFDDIKWETVVREVWLESMQYCSERMGEKIELGKKIDLSSYLNKWAATLEWVVVETTPEGDTSFVQVTVAGDGGCYLIDTEYNWFAIKDGKRQTQKGISNLVTCLPLEPKNVKIRKGTLLNGEFLFLVTDGYGDEIETNADLRRFLGSKLVRIRHLSDYINVLSVAVKGMDDDKTGILIKREGNDVCS